MEEIEMIQFQVEGLYVSIYSLEKDRNKSLGGKEYLAYLVGLAGVLFGSLRCVFQMSGTMMIQSWILRKVKAVVQIKDLRGVQLIGRVDKALLREALDEVEGEQVLLSVVRNYDGRNVSTVCIFCPWDDRKEIALTLPDSASGVQRKL
jgi:hypothetical protein